MSAVLIQGVQFHPDGGVTIAYARFPDDARTNGMGMTHQVYAPPDDPQTADDLELLARQAERTLRTLLERYGQLEPTMPSMVDGSAEEGEDDDAGPYDNPEERDLSERVPEEGAG